MSHDTTKKRVQFIKVKEGSLTSTIPLPTCKKFHKGLPPDN